MAQQHVLLSGVVALLLLAAAEGGHPLRVLGLFPHPGVSHFHFFHPIMRGLAEAGHEVTVISHFPDKSPTVRYRDLALTGHSTLKNTIEFKMLENRHVYDHFVEFFMLEEWAQDACNRTLKSNALAQVLREKTRYDVILVELFNTDCMLGVAHVLKAPVIGLSSSAMMPWHYDYLGAPSIPSYMPTVFVGQSEEMDFFQRFGNWASTHILKFMYKWYAVPHADALIQYKFGHDVPSVGELGKETSMFFVNQHFSLSGAKPLPPSVIELGGIHIQKSKPLDVDLQRILDNAEHGAIIISWGSMVRAESLPAQKREGLLRALKRLKMQVIWKWENDTLPDKPDNVHIRKWLPQLDLLCHPNVKVFMAHAGLMGSSEAAYCGVPVIATPMYGDQFLNAAALQQRGMAVILHYEQFSENSIFRALKKVMEKQYMENARAVSHSFKHRPQTALQSALFWVEYVARTEGAPLMKSRSVYLSRLEYHQLDIYLVVATILALTICTWVWLFRKCCRRKNAPTEKFKRH